MIPTMLLVGLLLGRWWKVVIPVSAVIWTVLVATSTGTHDYFAAFLLGAANVGVGVLFNLGIRLVYREMLSARWSSRG